MDLEEEFTLRVHQKLFWKAALATWMLMEISNHLMTTFNPSSRV
jgi:hypothetical protein